MKLTVVTLIAVSAVVIGTITAAVNISSAEYAAQLEAKEAADKFQSDLDAIAAKQKRDSASAESNKATSEPEVVSEPEQPAAQQYIETIFVPDFIGYTETEVRNWALTKRFKGSIMTGDTGFNPYLPCVTQKIGPVTYQSISPGTEIENVPGTKISIDVDCEREHWVQ